MRVTMDGAPAAFGWSGCATLGDLVKRAEEVCASRQHVVMGISADGGVLDMTDRKGWRERPLEGIQDVALSTLPMRQLLVETLDEMKTHFPALRQELEKATSALRAGRSAEALQSLGKVMSLWQACLAVASDVSRALGLDAAKSQGGQESLGDRVERLRLAISPLDEALRRRDLVLVADLCAYEIPPLVDQWEEAIGALRQAAGA